MDNYMTETFRGHWNDRWNDRFIDRSGYGRNGKTFHVSYRSDGNGHVFVSKHRKLDKAIAAALAI